MADQWGLLVEMLVDMSVVKMAELLVMLSVDRLVVMWAVPLAEQMVERSADLRAGLKVGHLADYSAA